MLMLALTIAAPAAAHRGEPHGDEAAPATEMAMAAPETRSQVPGPPPPAEAAPRRADAMAVARNLHPLSVHFPIALLLVAAFLEVAGIARRRWRADAAVRLLLVTGAAGALVAALLGWVHTGPWLGGDAVMQWHRWMGSAIALVAVALAWHAGRASERRVLLRTALVALALAVAVQGYLGGELSHGPGHLFAA
ncbi:hypothetical protein L8951_00500 [Sphingomicrobium astaxanthinifaciens]|nr:DUF2231 domain-containing protein [Sphingomicrobium astaxanthinifaciens]MCJ7420295.1 hypothetical protein [Sphingomicrobium astaxanthinifaciens]